MSPLKILMFTTFYPPFNFGGDGIGVQRMARALVARGHQVTVVHDEDAFLLLGGTPGAEGAPDGVRRIGLRAGNGFLSTVLTQQTGRPVVHGRRLAALIAELQPDILWHNNLSLVGGPGLLAYGEALKVYEAHEHWLVCPTHVLWRYGRELCDGRDCLRCSLSYRRPPQLWRATGLLDRMLDRVDLIIAKSEFSRAKHAEFGLRQPMTVVPYFLPDLPAPAPAAAQGESPHARPYFLFVGRLEKIKGLQDVFPAMAQFPDADLVILGDGDYAAELKRLAAGRPNIHFLGRKPPEALDAYYRHARALVVPSVCYETFGLILIESFRLGTPVIARRLGPFPEIVEAAGGGLLFEDAAGLVAAMRRLATDPAARDRMAAAARAGFLAHWQETRVLARYETAFAEAAARSGRPELARRLSAGAFSRGA